MLTAVETERWPSWFIVPTVFIFVYDGKISKYKKFIFLLFTRSHRSVVIRITIRHKYVSEFYQWKRIWKSIP